MKPKHHSNTTKELVEEVKNQIAITDLSVFSGKLLYQDDFSATYFLLAQVEKNKAKKPKKIVQKSVGLFSWDTVLLVSLWTAFLCLIAMS